MKPINVLSVFDGMSCGQIALERSGIKVKNYYASEIDKYAIQVTKKNYPNTIHLGDIQNWESWNIETPDLIIAGSPCQGFSNAGHGLNFDDPRSKLFFTFKDILFYWIDRNPNLKFLLENVKMKKEWKDVISDFMGTEPILINSALVSAQNRERLYWSNWKFEQPEDRDIYLKDIVEDGEVDRAKSFAIDANYFKGSNGNNYFNKSRRQIVFKGAALRNQVTKRGTEAQLNIRKDDKSNCVVPSYPQKLNGLVFVGGVGDKDWAKDGKKLSRNYPQGRRIYSDAGKSTSLTSQGVGSIGGYTGIYQIHKDEEIYYRKLTPLECERLQTVPENYTEGVSNTQRYKMLGNGWTVDVIAHILSFL